MRPVLATLLMILCCGMMAQDGSGTISIYCMVPDNLRNDVSLFINTKPIYPGPLGFKKKLVHHTYSEGTVTLVAKVTNKPGYKSVVQEVQIERGRHLVFTLSTILGANDTGTLLLFDITDDHKQVNKLKEKEDKWTVVTSREDPDSPYLK